MLFFWIYDLILPISVFFTRTITELDYSTCEFQRLLTKPAKNRVLEVVTRLIIDLDFASPSKFLLKMLCFSTKY